MGRCRLAPCVCVMSAVALPSTGVAQDERRLARLEHEAQVAIGRSRHASAPSKTVNGRSRSANAARTTRERERDRAENVVRAWAASDRAGAVGGGARAVLGAGVAGAARADAALYWRAYSLDKLNRQADALTTVAELLKTIP